MKITVQPHKGGSVGQWHIRIEEIEYFLGNNISNCHTCHKELGSEWRIPDHKCGNHKEGVANIVKHHIKYHAILERTK